MPAGTQTNCVLPVSFFTSDTITMKRTQNEKRMRFLISIHRPKTFNLTDDDVRTFKEKRERESRKKKKRTHVVDRNGANERDALRTAAPNFAWPSPHRNRNKCAKFAPTTAHSNEMHFNRFDTIIISLCEQQRRWRDDDDVGSDYVQRVRAGDTRRRALRMEYRKNNNNNKKLAIKWLLRYSHTQQRHYLPIFMNTTCMWIARE